MIGLTKWAFPLAFLASCSSEATTVAGSSAASCDDILRDRVAFRKEMQAKAQNLKTELGLGAVKSGGESYPKLKDSQKLMEFQTELQGEENKFEVRLRECQETKK